MYLYMCIRNNVPIYVHRYITYEHWPTVWMIQNIHCNFHSTKSLGFKIMWYEV